MTRIKISETFWICMYVRSTFIYVMIRQVQSLYRYGHIFWMNEFNIDFLLAQKINIYVSLPHVKRKKIKEKRITKIAWRHSAPHGAAWMSGVVRERERYYSRFPHLKTENYCKTYDYMSNQHLRVREWLKLG